MKEFIAEMRTTEWNGAKVRVEVELPWLSNTVTSQIVLDSRDVESLKWVKKPDYIDRILSETEKYIVFMEWNHKREKARSIMDIIAQKIACHLADTIANVSNES